MKTSKAILLLLGLALAKTPQAQVFQIQSSTGLWFPMFKSPKQNPNKLGVLPTPLHVYTDLTPNKKLPLGWFVNLEQSVGVTRLQGREMFFQDLSSGPLFFLSMLEDENSRSLLKFLLSTHFYNAYGSENESLITPVTQTALLFSLGVKLEHQFNKTFSTGVGLSYAPPIRSEKVSATFSRAHFSYDLSYFPYEKFGWIFETGFLVYTYTFQGTDTYLQFGFGPRLRF